MQYIPLSNKKYYFHGKGLITLPVGVNRNPGDTAWTINYREDGESRSEYFADVYYGGDPYNSLLFALEASEAKREALLIRRMYNRHERRDKVKLFGQAGVLLNYIPSQDSYRFKIKNPMPYEKDIWIYIGKSKTVHERIDAKKKEAIQIRQDLEARYLRVHRYVLTV